MRLIHNPKPIIRSLAVVVIVAFMATPAMAQMDDTYRPFQNWDSDNNSKLTQQEFFEGVTDNEIFTTWDEDDNGSLNENELETGIYKKWETYGENFKTKAEARATTWTRYYAGTFDDWDLNGDGTVTNAEYNEKIGKDKKLHLGEKMDANNNGQIEKREFYGTIFKMWDEDENGVVSQDEYDPDEYTSWFL